MSIKPQGRASTGSDASNPIKKKIDALVSSKLHNDQDFIKMMDYVAPMVGEIDIHTEHRLMEQLEDREVEANREYLEAFGKNFVALVRSLKAVCDDMADKIQSNKSRTQDLLTKTAALQDEKKTLERKQVVINEFLEKYSLTAEEEAALQGSAVDGTVDSKFFAALQHVKQIHEECKQLLRANGEHLAALEVLEEMARKLEQAYEVLYRSIQRECRLLNVDFLELRGVLVQSIAAMQDREVLFKYALEEYVTARRNHIVRAYIDALTRGGGRGSPKPIELLSHDPLRRALSKYCTYIGDMLAWIHQGMASERELLQTFLKLCRPEVLNEHSKAVLSNISEALCRPFKVRVEQALLTESNSVVLYRLSCLFAFYGETMAPSLSEDAALLQTINELKELTLNMFFSGLNSSVQRLLGRMGTPDYDLLPVQAVHQILLLLRDVLESHDGAVAAVADKKENFLKANIIFAAVLDPLNQAVQLSATQLSSPLDIAVYTLNCLSTINSVIILYQYTDTRLEMIKAQGALSEIVGMEASRISNAMALFDSFLSNPDSYRLNQCAKISSVRIRDSVQQRTVENLVAAYSVIYQKLVDPSNKFTSRKMFQQRRRQQNFGVYLLAYHLLQNDYIPPVTLAAILFQMAVFLGFVPPLGPWKTREMCLLPSRIIHHREWIRMLASVVMHGDDMHLYYNMISLLWKGRRLERRLGSWRFLLVLLVFAVATSGGIVALSVLADDVLHLHGLRLAHQCAIGFSGVLFALKVLHTTYFPYEDALLLGWMPIPSRYACWAELVLIQLLAPEASFVGHLSGILVGLLYTHGPLKYFVDLLESLMPLSFGLPGEVTSSRYGGFFRRTSTSARGGTFRNWGSGTTGFSSSGRPTYGWRTNGGRDYDVYTGGLSEEEQMRRAMDESLRSRTRANTPNAPPFPDNDDSYLWR
ncbi:Conserved oligomeric Golgi complex subunit 6 [Toxocara canis]|uniref:Conserved oligomeric Golgi complex subunit 6 n=1 Tax=Toxocara canis TaxID=6265 RepID=A0A0B2VL03_TOXCA|nr:Conserved oligomeric Golgi complex subunit 6 [Toxocara canis]